MACMSATSPQSLGPPFPRKNLWSAAGWKPLVEKSRNKQLVSFKLCAVLPSLRPALGAAPPGVQRTRTATLHAGHTRSRLGYGIHGARAHLSCFYFLTPSAPSFGGQDRAEVLTEAQNCPPHPVSSTHTRNAFFFFFLAEPYDGARNFCRSRCDSKTSMNVFPLSQFHKQVCSRHRPLQPRHIFPFIKSRTFIFSLKGST